MSERLFQLALETRWGELVKAVPTATADQIQFRDSEDLYTPLHVVCTSCLTEASVAALRVLVAHGADVNALTKYMMTPLHLACEYKAHTDAIQLLIEHGADVNAKTVHEETPLSIGCLGASVETIRLLIENGARVNTRDTAEQFTPLHQACANNASADVIQLLIEHSADVNALDENGRSPLHCACSSSYFPIDLKVIQVLLDSEADVSLRDKLEGKTVLEYNLSDEVRELIMNRGRKA